MAERGFKATTVGDIEAAVGLVPRSGAMYKHFESKVALVEAAIQDRIDQVTSLADLTNAFKSRQPNTDPVSSTDRRATLLLIGQQILDELDREALISRIIEKDGDRFPRLRDRMHTEMVQPGFDFTEAALCHWIDGYHGPAEAVARLQSLDVSAVAAVVLSPLVNHRRHQWMFGQFPHGVKSDRFLDAWVDMTLLLFPEA